MLVLKDDELLNGAYSQGPTASLPLLFLSSHIFFHPCCWGRLCLLSVLPVRPQGLPQSFDTLFFCTAAKQMLRSKCDNGSEHGGVEKSKFSSSQGYVRRMGVTLFHVRGKFEVVITIRQTEEVKVEEVTLVIS